MYILCLTSYGVRRLHDTGKTGWWALLILFGDIWGVILLSPFALAQPSQDEVNEYGVPVHERDDNDEDEE